ncbi:MAG: hypothetical protein WCE48_10145 [Steroidobacteraceae bacterium]
MRKIVALTVLTAGVAFAWDAQANVLRVVTVRTDNYSDYVKELERGKAILKRLGSSAVLRVWRAHFAGPNAGSVVVSIEYPSMVVLAQDEAKAYADPEYTSWLSGLASMRKVVSDSVYDEMKP